MIDWIYESDAVETFCWAEIDRTDIMIVRTDDMRWAWRLESSKDRLTPRGECATLEKAKSNALAALTRWQERADIVRELEVSLQALKEEHAMLRDAVREERAAVVAFMRGDPEWPACPQCRDAALYVTANAIERGEHRREERA